MKNEDFTLGVVKESNVSAFLGALQDSGIELSRCKSCRDEVNERNFLASMPEGDSIVLFCTKFQCFSELLLSMRRRNGNGLAV